MTDTKTSQYQLIINLPKADGIHDTDDWAVARAVQQAVREGLRERYVATGDVRIEKTPSPQSQRASDGDGPDMAAADPEPVEKSGGMSAGDFVAMVVNGPGWNK